MSFVVPIDVEKFINKEVPSSVRRKIIPLVKQGHELVNASIKDVSFLNWSLGKKHRGYLENIAVQYVLHQAAVEGLLNGITSQVMPNVNNSSHHVELRTENVIICINRASKKEKTARRAIYRSLLQTNNQLYWSFGDEILKEEPGYLELTYNFEDGDVNFINLGVPDGRGKWFNYIDLTKELHSVVISKEEKNEITKEQLVKFKDFAQGVQTDGGAK